MIKLPQSWEGDSISGHGSTQNSQHKGPKENNAKTIIIKMTKNKDKYSILTAARERKKVTYKGKPIRQSSGYHQKPYRPEENSMIYLMQ